MSIDIFPFIFALYEVISFYIQPNHMNMQRYYLCFSLFTNEVKHDINIVYLYNLRVSTYPYPGVVLYVVYDRGVAIPLPADRII